jgi:hypothetical protein
MKYHPNCKGANIGGGGGGGGQMGTTWYEKNLLSKGIKVEKRPNEMVASFPRYDPIIMPAHHLLFQQIDTKPLPNSSQSFY